MADHLTLHDIKIYGVHSFARCSVVALCCSPDDGGKVDVSNGWSSRTHALNLRAKQAQALDCATKHKAKATHEKIFPNESHATSKREKSGKQSCEGFVTQCRHCKYNSKETSQT